MCETLNIGRSLSFTALLIVICVCVGAEAQSARQSSNESCPRPRKITREKAGSDDTGEAWTTETSRRDGIISLTYCWMYENGTFSAARLARKNLLELPTGFEPHVKYGDRVGEKIKIKDLPLGFTLYKDMAFEVRTKAYIQDVYITVRVPSTQNNEEFKKLRILFLDEAEPGALR